MAEQDPINPEPAVVAALVGNLENERAGQVPPPDNPVEAPQNPEVNLIWFFLAGLDIATHWSPMRPKIKRWRLHF